MEIVIYIIAGIIAIILAIAILQILFLIIKSLFQFLWWIISGFFKLLWWVISAPFRLIGAIFEFIGSMFDETRDQTTLGRGRLQSPPRIPPPVNIPRDILVTPTNHTPTEEGRYFDLDELLRNLVGKRDRFSGEILEAGSEVYVCCVCQNGYKKETWEEILSHKQGKCERSDCPGSEGVKLHRLPGIEWKNI